MRKTFLTILTFISVVGFGQSIKRSSINSAGASSPNLLYTMGQVSSLSSNVAGNNITLGFQQPVRIPLDTSMKVKSDTAICIKDSVTLLSANAPHVNWYRNDTLITGADSSFYVIKSTGKYKALLYDDYGFNELTRTVLVNVYASLLPIPSVNELNICQGSKTTPLTALATQGAILLWYGLDSTGGTQSTIAPTPNSSLPGTFAYYVSQRPADAICESQRTKLIVNITSIPSKAPNDSVSYCFSSLASPINLNFGSDVTVAWYGTDSIGGTSSATAPLISTAFAGRTNYYFAKQSVVSKCESPRSIYTVIVHPLPSKPTISRDANGNLVSSALIGNQWYKDTTLMAGASSSLYKPDMNGTYSVKTVQLGCSSPMSNVYYYLTTAVVNYSNGQFIKVYPNPVRNTVYVDWSIVGEKNMDFLIFDQTGKLILRKHGVKSGESLNLSGLISGMYQVVVSTEKGKILYRSMLYKD